MTVYCGVDFHARQQTVAWCDTSDGEIHLEKLDHQDHNLIRSFYARWGRGLIVGLEASGYSQWFETLLATLGHQCWVGNATEVRRRARSRQKNDRRDAEPSVPISLETLSSNSLMSRAKEVFNVSRLVIIIEARESISDQG